MAGKMQEARAGNSRRRCVQPGSTRKAADAAGYAESAQPAGSEDGCSLVASPPTRAAC